MKRCQKCSNLMPDDVMRCIHCGHESAPAALAKRPPFASYFANSIALGALYLYATGDELPEAFASGRLSVELSAK